MRKILSMVVWSKHSSCWSWRTILPSSPFSLLDKALRYFIIRTEQGKWPPVLYRGQVPFLWWHREYCPLTGHRGESCTYNTPERLRAGPDQWHSKSFFKKSMDNQLTPGVRLDSIWLTANISSSRVSSLSRSALSCFLSLKLFTALQTTSFLFKQTGIEIYSVLPRLRWNGSDISPWKLQTCHQCPFSHSSLKIEGGEGARGILVFNLHQLSSNEGSLNSVLQE